MLGAAVLTKLILAAVALKHALGVIAAENRPTLA
jgi:hypothetical protein